MQKKKEWIYFLVFIYFRIKKSNSNNGEKQSVRGKGGENFIRRRGMGQKCVKDPLAFRQ